MTAGDAGGELTPEIVDIDGLLAAIVDRSRSRRSVVGLTGPPGAGKSTLAERLRREVGAVVAPMDGFHRRNADLDRAGLLGRKGAPETFDADAFVDRVERVVDGALDIAWPSFDRDLDEPVGGSIVVPADAPLVVVEGNYLLLDEAPWNLLPGLIDLTVFVRIDADERRRRLVARHVTFGRSPDEAADFVLRSDEANAAIVEATAHRADLIVQLD